MMQKGFSQLLIPVILFLGVIAGVILAQRTAIFSPKAYDKNPYDQNSITGIKKYSEQYLSSASKNIINLENGKKCIIPSQAYTDGIYIRDAFYSVVGLQDILLSKECFSLFEENIDKDGRVHYAIPTNPDETYFGFKDDESNLIYLIWAGILHRNGVLIDQEKIEKAYSFANTYVNDSWFISPAGDYRYWGDTYKNQEGDTITYNQGLYALSLQFVNELNPQLVSENLMIQAANNYKSLFKQENNNFLPLSRNTTHQDTSSLLPEFLMRFYFNQGIIDDVQIIASVDNLLNKASVYDEQKRLIGIKVTFAPDGSFLSPDVFSTNMNNTGVYQNGGYWPMYTLADLALAYKINGDIKYKTIAEKLMEKELGSDKKSKEFLYLEPYRAGSFDKERVDYSWNALITTAIKWSGMTQ